MNKKIILALLVSWTLPTILSAAGTTCPCCPKPQKPKECPCDRPQQNTLGCEPIQPCPEFFVIRSQGANTARELIGWQDIIHQPNRDSIYTSLAFAFEYQKSFDGDGLARYMFGRETLTFSGSQVEGREQRNDELLADYFGLSPEMKGCITFNAHISNIIFDTQFYLGFDNICPGVYLRLHFPLTRTRWNLDCCATTLISTEPFEPCYMGASSEPVATAKSIEEALNGDFTFGGMDKLWCFCKFPCSPCCDTLAAYEDSKTKLADIDIIFGYDFVMRERRHFGLFLQTVAPTGNRPEPSFVIGPVVGNDHWKVGGGLSFHTDIWEKDNQLLSFWLEGNFLHPIAHCQRRCFDFCEQGCYSRYMLLKEFDANSLNPTGRLIPAHQITTRLVEIHSSFEGDASFKLAYRTRHLILDIGYNVWGRTRESIDSQCCKCDDDCDARCANCPIDTTGKLYGFKGCTPVCTDDANPLSSLDNTIDLAATAFACTLPIDPDVDEKIVEATRDNLLNPSNINCFTKELILRGARRGLTSKIFLFAGYSWDEHRRQPFIGAGFSTEFSHHEDGKRNALSQWGFTIKGGLTF